MVVIISATTTNHFVIKAISVNISTTFATIKAIKVVPQA